MKDLEHVESIFLLSSCHTLIISRMLRVIQGHRQDDFVLEKSKTLLELVSHTEPKSCGLG